MKAVKGALAVEIASLVELVRHQNYAREIRAHAARIRETGQQFGYPVISIPITHSYFSVLEANANLVGEMTPNDVVHVISFYQRARSLADSLSKEGTPDNRITPVAEAADRYEALASAIDKLCDLGVTVSRDLASKEVLDQTAEVAVQLRPAE